ncbi:hypothetical protein BTA51_13675 [Hahella sp. CCB-MM4]|uniref:hypothetical protein n=1 Tax=Hahella sp. (strain CCB-MM4) TaxID=1926491 RepID=UPI000B9A22E2|nr:hypothetical protein [Hahella sp. CCB-MM4]OZG72999.1 hypothetical protein BTA51_13675 [Hahella sp. CCB-MM4]
MESRESMDIRRFDEQKDIEGLKACIVELQDYEKALDTRLPSGEEIIDRYYPEMIRRNNI